MIDHKTNHRQPDSERVAWTGRQEPDLLLQVLAGMEDEVWFADLQGRFTLFNPAARRNFGLALEPPVKIETAASAVEAFHPDGTPRPPGQSPMLRFLRGEAIDSAEEILRLPAIGELRYRQFRLSWVRDRASKPIGVVAVVRDITPLKPFATEGLDLLRRTKGLVDLVQQVVVISRSTDQDASPSPEAMQLTARQCEILGLLAEGLTAPEIARRLFISVETVRTHHRNLLRKLGLHNKAELIRYAVEHKMIKGRRRGDSP